MWNIGLVLSLPTSPDFQDTYFAVTALRDNIIMYPIHFPTDLFDHVDEA